MNDFRVIYVVCEIIATAHRLALSSFRDEKAFIDKLDYQISLTEVLLKKIEEFRIVREIHFVHYVLNLSPIFCSPWLHN